MKATSTSQSVRPELYEQYVSAFTRERPAEVAFYDAAAFAYYGRKYRPILSGIDRHARVLDLGCGSGRMMSYLRSLGFTKVTGVDLSSEQVRMAQQRGEDAVAGDALGYLSEVGGAFDFVVALDIFEHFQKHELLNLAMLLWTAMAPGASLLVKTPNGAGLFPHAVIYGDLTHCTILTPTSLRQLLSVRGFEDFQFFEEGPVCDGLKGFARSAVWWAVRGVAGIAWLAETGKRQRVWTENMICLCKRKDEL